MSSRPFRLRLLVDVSLTETEWTLFSQASLREASESRSLAVLILDRSKDKGLIGKLRRRANVVAAVDAKAADLRLELGPREIQSSAPASSSAPAWLQTLRGRL